jgi:phosphoribosylformylglycinamidine synthase
MAHKIEITSKIADAQAVIMKKKIENMGFSSLEDIELVSAYTIDYEFSQEELEKIANMLTNPITQEYKIDSPTKINANWILEIGFLPGVTDNVANTTQEAIHDLFNMKFDKTFVFTSEIIFLKGNLTKQDIENIAENLANQAIQRIHIKNIEQYEADNGMDCTVPRVKLTEEPSVDLINLDISDNELTKLGKQGIMNKDGSRRGPLALDLESMKTIRNYFKEKERRMPTDIELESVAQTWSEHCKHTIFANQLDEIKKGIYKEYIKNATNKIRAEREDRDFCVSVFKDNSGAIIFDENYLVTDKVETHNSPSALDPFGGSITGIVGVNRDTIGFGLGAMPIINRYGYCFGYPKDKSVLFRGKDKTNPALSPKRIMDGVIEGVKVGGNCSGIPTPQGFLYFDNSYKGKPLIYVGTIGLIPRQIGERQGHEKKAEPGDCIVVIGGRVGKDGIHGATFSSEALDSGSPATAVQIGDPITQKKLSDAIVKEARDINLYSSITDNGAGGLSCSVAEMAKECGGFVVDLEKIPVKYTGIQPWEIWISESQERMTLAVPIDKLNIFLELMKKRGVEATVIGEFNDTDRAVIKYKGEKILDIDMAFLHEGVPKKTLTSTYTKKTYEEPNFSCPFDLTSVLLTMLSRHNITSFEFISRQYDHEVQASSILKPLQGIGDVNAYATATKPLYDSKKAIITSQGITSKYSQIDTYDMAACAIDTAIRNVIAAGGDLNRLALLDNFCWCSSEDPERLGQLKAAAKACYDYSIAYKTPFISGKDSMFNDFKGYNENNDPLKISVLPTLLVSSISVIKDYNKTLSLDAKFSGDFIYVLGETKNELGASEYFELIGEHENGKPYIGNSVPKVDASKAYNLYSVFNKAVEEGLISSSIPINSGGLGVALAKTCIAGKLGARVDLTQLNKAENVDRNDFALFSESQSRIIVTIAPENQEKFERLFKNVSFARIGQITNNEFVIIGLNGSEIIRNDIDNLTTKYKETFKEY